MCSNFIFMAFAMHMHLVYHHNFVHIHCVRLIGMQIVTKYLFRIFFGCRHHRHHSIFILHDFDETKVANRQSIFKLNVQKGPVLLPPPFYIQKFHKVTDAYYTSWNLDVCTSSSFIFFSNAVGCQYIYYIYIQHNVNNIILTSHTEIRVHYEFVARLRGRSIICIKKEEKNVYNNTTHSLLQKIIIIRKLKLKQTLAFHHHHHHRIVVITAIWSNDCTLFKCYYKYIAVCTCLSATDSLPLFAPLFFSFFVRCSYHHSFYCLLDTFIVSPSANFSLTFFIQTVHKLILQ